MQRDELAAWLRLSLTPGLGNSGARRLLSAFGLPQNLWQQSYAAISEFVTPAQAQALAREPQDLSAQTDAVLQWLESAPAAAQRRLLTLADADYPQALLEMADPPLLLYVQGYQLLWPERALAMVGSRNPSPQGEANALAFARSFAGSGIAIVSGMALGIDGAAHRGALQGAAQALAVATIAVVGTGLDRVYPKQHHELAHTIAQRGLLVSEYPLGTPPLAANFPKRNRLIAALSQGTLVVEAALQSGSLITARLAAEQGKEVFAIPGSIHTPHARGCHALIKQGAKLVETVDDVLQELRWQTTSAANKTNNAMKNIASKARPSSENALENSENLNASRAPLDALLQVLGHDPTGLDALCQRSGCDAATLQAQLLELELAGEVARLPGGLFQRVVRA